MEKMLNTRCQESDFTKPDEYWEAVLWDEESYPEKADCEGECDVDQIFGPVSEVELLGQRAPKNLCKRE